MQWVASTLHSTSEHAVSSITTADTHSSAASSRLNWRRPPADLNGLANAVGSQYPSLYLRTRCIQHYYRWYAQLVCQQSTELTPPGRFNWTRPLLAKDEIWFLRVCHHISSAVYSSCAAVSCGAVSIVGAWYLFWTWHDAVVTKYEGLHHRLRGGTKENGERSQYSRWLEWKLRDLPTEASCPVMMLMVGVTVLGNGHAVTHRNLKIFTDIINYDKRINNPNK